MADPATNVRIETGSFGLLAKGVHRDARLESGCKGPAHFAVQLQEFAGVGPFNAWDRAGTAQGTLPGCTKQATFFAVAAAIVITIEILAFRTGWSFHIFNVPQACGTFPIYTRVM